MEAGQKEVMEAFETTMTNNVKATVEHANETRRMTRDFMNKVNGLEALIIQQKQEIDTLRTQLAAIQTVVFRGGTSGNQR